MMAKPKQETLVQELPNNRIHVWTNEPEKEIAGISRIEGITFLILLVDVISVFIDPRYDQKEIANEIRELLSAEVPDIFRKDKG